jgi:hypothetical protein
MLADVSLLLHEINDAVRVRRTAQISRAVKERVQATPATVFVTGLASSGKARLVDALLRRLEPAHIDVRAAQPPPLGTGAAALHVHAETDIEALIEGGLKLASQQDARHADLVVPVDWESAERSVSRVIEALVERGLADVEAGV